MSEVPERTSRADVLVRVREDGKEKLTTRGDFFSRGATGYAAHRPRYPRELFVELSRHVHRRSLAWDCATGNGQAAIGLATHFARVVATDASYGQLRASIAHERVHYWVASAEASGIASQSADLVTVAQALHWLDREEFFREAARVLAPRGLIAVWCYQLIEIEPRIDALVRQFAEETVGPYWPPGRDLVNSGYQTIAFPFDEISLPPFAIEGSLNLDSLTGYLRTWSATQRFADATGSDPVDELRGRLGSLWGDAASIRPVRWPLCVRAGRRDR